GTGASRALSSGTGITSKDGVRSCRNGWTGSMTKTSGTAPSATKRPSPKAPGGNRSPDATGPSRAGAAGDQGRPRPRSGSEGTVPGAMDKEAPGAPGVSGRAVSGAVM